LAAAERETPAPSMSIDGILDLYFGSDMNAELGERAGR